MANNYIDLDHLNRIYIDIGYEPVLHQIAKDCCEEIKQKCQSHNWKDYKDDWKVKMKKDKSSKKYYYLVYNEKNYRLTHLFENGHLIANKIGGLGWSSARPHIKPAFDKAEKELDTKVKKETTINISEKGN